MIAESRFESEATDIAKQRRHARPIVVGEVLFDVFPDGSRVLGGAPFNVAWHLHAFGFEPLMITRIGGDSAGDEIRRAMAGWGMDEAGVQLDSEVATGEVAVTLAGGEPSFEIVPDRAWDRIDCDQALAAIANSGVSLLYHGTLIGRSEPSMSTVLAIRDLASGSVFVDVNLRDPWWTPEGVFELVAGARWVKLNQDELIRLSDSTQASDGVANDGDGIEPRSTAFADRLRLEQLVVTRGGEGAHVRSGGATFTGRPPAAIEVIDSVGAGDAFSAVWIVGLLCGWSPQTTLDRALAFAAEICRVRGATTNDRTVYGRVIEGWRGPPTS
jgi:fructokinase